MSSILYSILQYLSPTVINFDLDRWLANDLKKKLAFSIVTAIVNFIWWTAAILLSVGDSLAASATSM